MMIARRLGSMDVRREKQEQRRNKSVLTPETASEGKLHF